MYGLIPLRLLTVTATKFKAEEFVRIQIFYTEISTNLGFLISLINWFFLSPEWHPEKISPITILSAIFSTFCPKAGYGKYWVDKLLHQILCGWSLYFKMLFNHSVLPWALKKENSNKPVQIFRNQALEKKFIRWMFYNTNIGRVVLVLILWRIFKVLSTSRNILHIGFLT